MLIGEKEQKKIRFNIIFRNIDFDIYNNAIDSDYDSEETIFTGWLYKVNTPEFKRVNRSQYGRVTDFKQNVVEHVGSNCFIPTSGTCFIKCMNHLIGKDCLNEF